MWELIFLMLVLKIPIVYLCLVVWWAIRAEPQPPQEAPLVPVAVEPDDSPRPGLGRRPARRPDRRGPHGAPRRGVRAGGARVARAEARR